MSCTVKNRGQYVVLHWWRPRKKCCELLKEYCLHEFDSQINAIRLGLATIVPISLLPLFTYKELRTVCDFNNSISIVLL